MNRTLAFLLSGLISFPAFSQLTVTGGQTPTQLVQNVLVGSPNTAFNITSPAGLPSQFAQFNGANSNIGFASGLVMSTSVLTNPNGLNGPAALGPPPSSNTGGYPLLSQTVGGLTTYDAAVVTFQFIPTGDTVMFDYVFASEEYHVYVNSSFNDVFGFFLSGPNPFGPAYNNRNIAIVPGTVNTPVSINNVNNGQTFNTCSPGTNPSNSQYFFDNCNGTTVCYNGFTVPLTAIAPVIPCSTYTITLAIANVGDHSLGSAVFLEANSFMFNTVSISAANNTINGAVDTALYEGCGTVDMLIVRAGDISDTQTVNLNYSGSAMNGVDYSQLPPSIQFQPNQDTIILTITPIWDMIPEGTELITITVNSPGICGNSTSSVIHFNLYNTDPLTINAGNDTVIDCTGGPLMAHVTGGVPNYQISWSDGTGYSGVNMSLGTTIYPTSDGYYYAMVTDECGNQAIDSVYVDYYEPVTAGFSINAPTPSDRPLEGCGYADVVFNRQFFLNQQMTYPIQITGTATNGTDYTMIPGTITFPPNATSVTVTVSPLADALPEGIETVTLSIVDTNCNQSLVPYSVTVNIMNVDPLTINAGPDIIVNCPRTPQSINTTTSGGWGAYAYLWNTGEMTPNLANLTPPSTFDYIVGVTDSCGNEAIDTVNILIPVDPVADFTFPNGIYCEPEALLFTDLSVTGPDSIASYIWNVSDGTTYSGTNPTITFPVAGTFDITLVVTSIYNCKDSVTQQVVVNPVPEAIPFFSPQNPTTLYPEVSFWDESLGGVTMWNWNVAGNYFNTPEFDYFFQGAGTYPVELIVTNPWGCADTVAFDVIVKDETAVYIPNTFSPDNNELNEYWGPMGVNWDIMELRVFDRWGEEVFFSTKKEYMWNGSKFNSGNILKQDVYVYKLYIIDFYGKEYNYTGQVNLLR